MNDKIYVWDRFIRLFHWSLVLTFSVSYLTGEEESLVHVYTGYAVLGLVAARIIWGFSGPEYARFSNLITPPGEAIAYLKGLATGGAKRYIGHNPAGGWMVIALFVCLTLTVLSGLKVYGIEGYGPLAGDPVQTVLLEPAHRAEAVLTIEHDGTSDPGAYIYADFSADSDDSDAAGESEAAEEFWEELHELLANLTVLLIVVHIAGVIISSLRHHQNLVKSMFTGYKRL